MGKQLPLFSSIQTPPGADGPANPEQLAARLTPPLSPGLNQVSEEAIVDRLSLDAVRRSDQAIGADNIRKREQNRADVGKMTYSQLWYLWKSIQDQYPPLIPDSSWDIHGPFDKVEGFLFFMRLDSLPAFAPMLEADHIAFKLVNPTDPAYKLSFFQKHSYFIKRPEALSTEQVEEYMTNYLNKLTYQIDILTRARKRKKELTISDTQRLAAYDQQRTDFTRYLQQIDRYEVVISNYFNGYTYYRVSYKVVLPDGTFTNRLGHLRKHQTDSLGIISEYRYNFIFVDPDEIVQKHFHQHKVNEAYLNGFPFASLPALGKDQIRLREKY